MRDGEATKSESEVPLLLLRLTALSAEESFEETIGRSGRSVMSSYSSSKERAWWRLRSMAEAEWGGQEAIGRSESANW